MSSPSVDVPHKPASLFGGRQLSRLFICGGVLLVVGGLFVAINKIRNAALVGQSEVNLKKIALAVQNYHDANNGRFPCLCDFGPSSPSGNGILSLHWLLVPYSEEGGCVALLFDPNKPEQYYGPPHGVSGNEGASSYASCTLQFLISPFEPVPKNDAPVFPIDVMSPTAAAPFRKEFRGWYATTNYVANGMVFPPQPGGTPPSIKTLKDGKANTLMLAERFQICKSADGDVPTLWGMGAYSATTASFALPTPTEEHPRTKDPKLALNQYVPPASVTKDMKLPVGFQVAPKAGTCDPRIMQTHNPLGMIVAMFDGSVRVLSPKIEPAVFWELVTPAGNETPKENW